MTADDPRLAGGLQKNRDSMNKETFLTDIPLSTAVAAYNGTSMSPERRGESTRNEYAQTMAEDYAELATLITNKPELATTLEAEFARYRAGYRTRYLDYLHSSSRCVSSFIAGPSNFPAARMNKRADIAHRRLNEFLDFRKRALEAIRRTLCPELRPIMAGDADAVDRLRAEIAEAEAYHAQLLGVNKAHKAFLKDPASLDRSPLPEKQKQLIRNYKPEYSWEPHPIPPYRFTNNGANIRRMKQRLETITAAKAAPQVEAEGTNARFEDCPPDNRVRLFFPGKPSAEVRTRLKSGGFRWSPTIGAWQAYRHDHTIELAKREAGLTTEPAQAEEWPPKYKDDPDRTFLAPEFIKRIEELAGICGKTPLAFYALWRKYANDCEVSDQSALLSEFEEWYKKDLAPVEPVPAGFVSDETWSE